MDFIWAVMLMTYCYFLGSLVTWFLMKDKNDQ